MARLAFAASLSLLIAGASADETVWSSVAYVLYGERTPLRTSFAPNLTPLGAQQLFSQGTTLRARWLDNSIVQTGITDYVPIHDVEAYAMDNSQLEILSTTDEYIVASAMAFMQGLYPPRNQTFLDLESAVLANHTLIDFPLSGYQYPKLQTFSVVDPSSTWIDGTAACTRYQQSLLEFKNDTSMVHLYDNSLSFYRSLWSTVFQPAFPVSMCSFYYAYDLYDYALYEYNHNPQIRNALNESGLLVLQALAASQQREINGDLTASGKYSGDMIRAISGRMLANKVVTQFKANVASGGKNVKMSLMFGSFEPFISFFALSNLVHSPWNSHFVDLPEPGAALVFELFSIDTKNTSVLPASSELNVRFLYRSSAEGSESFKAYPLFTNNSQASTHMSLMDFANAMDAVGLSSVLDWCDTCDSPSLFCTAFESNQQGGAYGSSHGSNANITPTIAGVIGAVVALAVVALAAAVAIFAGGMRFHRADKGRNSSLGGFKGAEKAASDVDISVAKGGVRHERVGSWELRGERDLPPVGAVFGKDTAVSGIKNDDDDDTISILGHTAVKPREHF